MTPTGDPCFGTLRWRQVLGARAQESDQQQEPRSIKGRAARGGHQGPGLPSRAYEGPWMRMPHLDAPAQRARPVNVGPQSEQPAITRTEGRPEVIGGGLQEGEPQRDRGGGDEPGADDQQRGKAKGRGGRGRGRGRGRGSAPKARAAAAVATPQPFAAQRAAGSTLDDLRLSALGESVFKRRRRKGLATSPRVQRVGMSRMSSGLPPPVTFSTRKRRVVINLFPSSHTATSARAALLFSRQPE